MTIFFASGRASPKAVEQALAACRRKRKPLVFKVTSYGFGGKIIVLDHGGSVAILTAMALLSQNVEIHHDVKVDNPLCAELSNEFGDPQYQNARWSAYWYDWDHKLIVPLDAKGSPTWPGTVMLSTSDGCAAPWDDTIVPYVLRPDGTLTVAVGDGSIN